MVSVKAIGNGLSEGDGVDLTILRDKKPKKAKKMRKKSGDRNFRTTR
jgi:hypothetical protein